MPYSSTAFDYYVGTLVSLLQPHSVCDIGAGAGKYGKIVRQIASRDQFNTYITGIEIDRSYVEQFQLREIYDEVVVDNAVDILQTPRVRFDLVFIGDCIEHLKKSDGLDLLNFLIYRAGYICVIYPQAYVQDDWQGHTAEAHLSTWSSMDFNSWDTLHHSWGGMHLFLVKGYQPSRMKITG
jgi:hypothetical protein